MILGDPNDANWRKFSKKMKKKSLKSDSYIKLLFYLIKLKVLKLFGHLD